MSQIPIGWWIDRGGSLAFNRYIDDDGIPNRPLYFYQKDIIGLGFDPQQCVHLVNGRKSDEHG